MKSSKGSNLFSNHDFLKFANMNTIKSNLLRLEEDNEIIRLIDGIYTIPKYSKLIDEIVYPDATELANKIAEKFSWSISPSGNLSLNLTGLSTQVPNEYVFISDGPYRTYKYRDRDIVFKKTSNRYIKGLSSQNALIVQAIKMLGKENIGNHEIKTLKQFYEKYSKTDILAEGKNLPIWIIDVLNEIRN